ncbi:MAG: hypothetical protein BroJett011_59330 [Chloroflexota bacterium]|nr:MAG: hypothetical protein BroJett011_59330 [Chloroflexota bacterium]
MQDVVLNAEDLKLFEGFYQRRLRDSGGVRDDLDELEVARDILKAVMDDGLTPTEDGSESYIRRGAMNWADPAAIQATQATSTNSGGLKTRGMTAPGGKTSSKEMIQGILMLIAGLAVAIWFFWPAKGKEAPKTEQPTVESTVEFSAEATVTPIPTLQSELLSDIVGGGVKTSLVVPRTLEVKGVSFVVQPMQITSGDWPLSDDERAVSWIYGTVINYTLGMHATPDNKALLSSLGPGDTLILRMSTGPVYRFAFADIVRVSPQSSEIFRQTRPGMTIALLGDEEASTRIVIRALYLSESDLGMDMTAPVKNTNLGETVVLADTLRLTPLGSRSVELQGMNMPGYKFLTVDFTIENKSGLPFTTSSFIHHIKAAGMTYAAVSVLPQVNSQLPYPPLPAVLQASDVVTTTAVYAVPEAGLAETLVWSFAPDPTGEDVEVSLPPNTTSPPTVTVKNANLEGSTLQLTFYIENPSQDIEINSNDLKIEGGTLSSIGNYFPWQAPAGNPREFFLLLSPDGSGRLTISFLHQAFEVTYPSF